MIASKFKKLKRLGFDKIKEEYMMGKHGSLTEKQLEYVLEHCEKKEHGGVCLRGKKK